MSRFTIVLLVAVLSSGCIKKKDYEALLAERDELQSKNDDMRASMDELGRKLRKMKVAVNDAENALRLKNEELAQQVSATGDLKADIQRMTQALRELEVRKSRADQSLKAYRDLVARFQSMIDAGTLRVKVIDGRMVVEMATDILFAPGSASLSREGKSAISEVASVLASIDDREFQVAGHTDDQPIHTAQFPSNWHLGSARSISVAMLLAESGLEPRQVSVASYAEHRPVDTNRTKEGRAMNRRIEIVVVPDLSTLPGYDELKAVSKAAPD